MGPSRTEAEIPTARAVVVGPRWPGVTRRTQQTEARPADEASGIAAGHSRPCSDGLHHTGGVAGASEPTSASLLDAGPSFWDRACALGRDVFLGERRVTPEGEVAIESPEPPRWTVPGQVAWNRARSAHADGRTGEAAPGAPPCWARWV